MPYQSQATAIFRERDGLVRSFSATVRGSPDRMLLAVEQIWLRKQYVRLEFEAVEHGQILAPWAKPVVDED